MEIAVLLLTPWCQYNYGKRGNSLKIKQAPIPDLVDNNLGFPGNQHFKRFDHGVKRYSESKRKKQEISEDHRNGFGAEVLTQSAGGCKFSVGPRGQNSAGGLIYNVYILYNRCIVYK